MSRIRIVAVVAFLVRALALALPGGAALADRVAGLAGIPPARAAAPAAAASAPALLSGSVSAVQADGARVQIDGKWYVLKPGRSLVLRKGLPVGTDALAKGQQVKFSLATATPGETALGVVHVP